MVLAQDAKTGFSWVSSWVKINKLLQDGMAFWEARALTTARSTFSQAAEIILGDLEMGIALDVSIVLYLSPEKWTLNCQSTFREFARFLSSATTECLGHQHPMTLVFRHLQEKDASKDERLRMWDCIIDSFDPTQPIIEWWVLAQRRWQYLFRIGRYDQAARYCRKAESLMRESKQFTLYMEIEVLIDLGVISHAQRDKNAAEEYYGRLLEVAWVDVAKYSYQISLTLHLLAEVHEAYAEIDQARQYLERRLEFTLEYRGTENADTVESFSALLRFCQRNGLRNETIHLKKRYRELHNHLEEITDGLWNIDLNDDSTEVELSNDLSKTEQEPKGVEAGNNILETDICAAQIPGKDLLETHLFSAGYQGANNHSVLQ